MKNTSEMTNVEMAEKVDNIAKGNLSQVPLSEIMDVASESAKRLRAMPEPEPDFFVGWKGKAKNEYTSEIYGEHNGKWFGRCGLREASWDGLGNALNSMSGVSDLIPNTPPEPEIWYRDPNDKDSDLFKTLDLAKDWMDAPQEVELRVVR